MTEAVNGLVQGSTVTLDSPVPPLDGKRVRVTLEPLDDADKTLSPDAQRAAWQEWVDRGPQGPIEDDENGVP